jgi:hypothetical protein
LTRLLVTEASRVKIAAGQDPPYGLAAEAMKTHLAIDLVGFPPLGLAAALKKVLKRISWPQAQSSDCTWRLELVWEDGTAWTVQGVPTMTESGHEMGSLRIEASPESGLPQGFRRLELDSCGLVVSSCRMASVHEENVTSECAIALSDDAGSGIVIATAPATGAVALWRFGDQVPKTEFDQSMFAWRPVLPSL